MKMLYHATKDKNWFRIEETNDYLDLNTGVFYENGNPTPHVPKSFLQMKCRTTLDESIREFAKACSQNLFTLEDCPAYLHQVERYAYAGKRVELGGIVKENLYYYVGLLAKFRDPQTFNRGYVDLAYLQPLYEERLREELGARYKNRIDGYHRYDVIIERLICIYSGEFADCELHVLLKFFVKQKLYLGSPDFIKTVMANWIEWKKQLNEPLTECPSHGLLIELAEARQRINNYDKAILNKLLSERNNQKCFYFQNDQFIAYPLSSCAAFHDEATQQENCIERMYMKDCADGKTHIVAVRSVFNPSQSLITCEIDPKTHKIKNWLCAHNAKDTNINSLQFREEYQKHLYENVK